MEDKIKLLNIKIRGWTATFRLPFLYSGTGLTSPVPPYSTILGMIGNIAAREIYPKDVGRMGYIFRSDGMAMDLERTVRFNVKNGRFEPNPEKKRYGIVNRQFHVNPLLDLYIENIDLAEVFENPKNPPALGRSQDLCWIETMKDGENTGRNYCIVEVLPVKEAAISGTLVPFPQEGAGGIIILLPEWFDNSKLGITRTMKKMGRFQAIRYDEKAPILKAKRENTFYSIVGTNKNIYLHSFEE
ncbi:MAG: CRISPR-associated protein Cas5 [Bacteroidota bacterium]|nr:CRISPR-associated protein Cas5 [Bacteroidota bacterium]